MPGLRLHVKACRVGVGCLGSCRRDLWCLFETFPAGSSASGCLWVTSAQRQVRRMSMGRVVVVVRGREAMALVGARFDCQMRRVLAHPCVMRISGDVVHHVRRCQCCRIGNRSKATRCVSRLCEAAMHKRAQPALSSTSKKRHTKASRPVRLIQHSSQHSPHHLYRCPLQCLIR